MKTEEKDDQLEMQTARNRDEKTKNNPWLCKTRQTSICLTITLKADNNSQDPKIEIVHFTPVQIKTHY